jgi:SAM-dependent methyltransferase
MGMADKLRELRWRAAGHYSRALPESFSAPVTGSDALEIGGPSRVFSAEGLLPVYPLLGAIDGVQWQARTVWHTLDEQEGYAPEGTRRGVLHVIEGVELAGIADERYGVVLCSHVLEHLANPLRALEAWRRVTRAGGHLLLVAPHMQGTFDHRREVTPLEHMIDDLRSGTGEDDLTHLPETLALHDRARDGEGADRKEWERRRRENASTRVLHHHTFTTPSLLRLLDHAGLQLLAVETRHPHDIYVLGSWPARGERPDNAVELRRRRRSPFSRDRGVRARGSSAP